MLPRYRKWMVMCLGVALLLCAPMLRAQTVVAKGDLDCNGFSKIQQPLKAYLPCTDFFSAAWGGRRGYDNGHYIGHDEPSMGFYSTAHHSGNTFQWDVTLPVERPLPAIQSFETFITFWFSLALCDDNSFPNGTCIPDSDENTPSQTGAAVLELQLYPPGFVSAISCDDVHWCAALNIDSLEITSAGALNPNCTEPVNFAYIQTNGVPTGPPGPNTATNATFNPNAQTLLMNQGDRLRITIEDTPAGLLTRIDDLSTGQTGFMIASGANGFQNTDPNTCAGANYNFHPEYDTAKFGNFVPWAVLQGNVNFAMELGHFEPGLNGDGDSDDAPCFSGPGDLVPGCLGADIDFDGPSYVFDWSNGSHDRATPVTIGSVAGHGVGPLSRSDDDNAFDQPYPIMQFEGTVSDSEAGCQTNGVGCVIPPTGAQFYPYYALEQYGYWGGCAMVFGQFSGPRINTFGGDKEYGPSNLPWFFGQNSGGPRANPCIPQTGETGEH
jgi:hypothetical protein